MCSPGKVFGEGVDAGGTHTSRSSSSRATNHPMGPKPENLRRSDLAPDYEQKRACTEHFNYNLA